MIDILEKEVDEKYYLDEKRIKNFKPIEKTIGKGYISVLGNTSPTGYNRGNVHDTIGIAPTLAARDFKDPIQILEPKIIQLGNVVDNKETFGGNPQRGRIYSPKGISPALNCMRGGGLEPKVYLEEQFKIRKLTPIECWRLQGFTDEQFYKAKSDGVSNSQLYKQAGNSVTVNVIDAIIKEIHT